MSTETTSFRDGRQVQFRRHLPDHLAQAIRDAVGLTRVPKKTVAKYIGISRGYLHDLEVGRRVPSLATVHGLVRWLKFEDDIIEELIEVATAGGFESPEASTER